MGGDYQTDIRFAIAHGTLLWQPIKMCKFNKKITYVIMIKYTSVYPLRNKLGCLIPGGKTILICIKAQAQFYVDLLRIRVRARVIVRLIILVG